MIAHPPSAGYVDTPTDGRGGQVARRYHFDLTDEDVEVYRELIEESLAAYESVRDRGAVERPVDHERAGGRRVSPDEDPYNAYVSRCSVSGSETGRLAGWDVAVKDNVAVAGVECTCGSRVLESSFPTCESTASRSGPSPTTERRRRRE